MTDNQFNQLTPDRPEKNNIIIINKILDLTSPPP